MASKHADIVDAVVTYLNGLSLSQEFTASREAAPTYLREELDSLTVDVLLGAVTRKRLTRGGLFDKTFDVEIAVQKTIDVSDTTDFDAMVELCEEIESAICAAGQTMASATLTAVDRDQVADEAAIETGHLFVSTITGTYRFIS